MLSELHLVARAAAQSAQDAARSTAQRAAAGTAAAATAASSAATAATVALLTKEEAAPVVGASGTIDVSAMDRAELERLVGQLSGVQAQLHAQVRRARAALKDSQAREQAAQSQLELARQATTLATEDAGVLSPIGEQFLSLSLAAGDEASRRAGAERILVLKFLKAQARDAFLSRARAPAAAVCAHACV